MARLTLILGVLATVIYLLDGFRFVLNEWRKWRNKGTWLVVVLCLLLPTSVYAEDLYFSQTGGGSGASCGDDFSAANFNNAAFWGVGAGKISAGDTAHLCGTITS